MRVSARRGRLAGQKLTVAGPTRNDISLIAGLDIDQNGIQGGIYGRVSLLVLQLDGRRGDIVGRGGLVSRMRKVEPTPPCAQERRGTEGKGGNSEFGEGEDGITVTMAEPVGVSVVRAASRLGAWESNGVIPQILTLSTASVANLLAEEPIQERGNSGRRRSGEIRCVDRCRTGRIRKRFCTGRGHSDQR